MTDDLPKKKGMPWWGILLMVFGAFVLVCGLGVGAVIWWVHANKDRLASEGNAAIEEGKSFAADHDQNACVDDGMRRANACDGLGCEVMTNLFLQTCLGEAEKSPTLCEGVPKKGEIVATSSWLVAECKRRGKPNNQRCQRILQTVVETCSRAP